VCIAVPDAPRDRRIGFRQLLKDQAVTAVDDIRLTDGPVLLAVMT
jgi:hypothetical protein